MFRGIRLSALGVTISALVALYGCSGSGDGDSTPSVKGGPLVRGEAVQEARAAAAVATPQFGTMSGVAQSSDVGVVAVTVEESLSGILRIRAKLGDGDYVVDTGHDDAEQGKNLFRVAGQEEGTRLVETFEDGDFQGADFYRRLEDGDLTDVPAGDLWVHVRTDFDGTDTNEDNYIAGGYWVFIPDDEEEEEGEPSFGVFVDGAAPYAVPAELTGDARYDGPANGVYSSGSGNRNREFAATVTLEAMFGDASADGRSGERYTTSMAVGCRTI